MQASSKEYIILTETLLPNKMKNTERNGVNFGPEKHDEWKLETLKRLEDVNEKGNLRAAYVILENLLINYRDIVRIRLDGLASAKGATQNPL